MRGAWIEMVQALCPASNRVGRSPCGERGLKFQHLHRHRGKHNRRSPCGERGLKLLSVVVLMLGRMSLPVRGAWIEIVLYGDFANTYASLPVRGAWIEMKAFRLVCPSPAGRSPCGERGLKYRMPLWKSTCAACRSPCGERGLKYHALRQQTAGEWSLPVRGAWIEIQIKPGYPGRKKGRSPCGERGLKCHR